VADTTLYPATVRLATEYYYWKPMAALFRSVELAIYRGTAMTLKTPSLDLGCGDGRLCRMLTDLGIMESATCGVDYSGEELKKAREVEGHGALVQADAVALPYASASFASVVANGFYQRIPQGADPALAETSRVLKPGGRLIATVPTNRFVEVQLVPRLIRTVSGSLYRRHVRRMNLRLAYHHVYPAEEWTRRFQNHGLEVIQHVEFFSPEAGRVWSILFMKALRVFGLLKLVKIARAQALFAGMMARVLTPTVRREMAELHGNNGAQHGYVLIVAEKT